MRNPTACWPKAWPMHSQPTKCCFTASSRSTARKTASRWRANSSPTIPTVSRFAVTRPALRAGVERAIRNLVVTREIAPIYAKWFESRLPNGERLGIPMSPQLAQYFAVMGVDGEAN